MPEELQSLKERVSVLEQKVADLSQGVRRLNSQEEFSAGWSRFMRWMGIDDTIPVDPVALQNEMLARGLDPEGTEFHQAIEEMREE